MYVYVLQCGNGIHSDRHMIKHAPTLIVTLQRSVAGGRCLVSHTFATSSESHSNYLNLKSRCVRMCVCVCLRVTPCQCFMLLLCLSVSEGVCVQ